MNEREEMDGIIYGADDAVPAPAPEPRCATCGAVKDSSLWTNTCAVAGKPAPEPSGTVTDAASRSNRLTDTPPPSGEMTRLDFKADLSVLGNEDCDGDQQSDAEDRLMAHEAALRARIDELHDQRHAEARKADALAERVANYELDRCENGHHTHEDCTKACSCVGLGKSRVEKAETALVSAETRVAELLSYGTSERSRADAAEAECKRLTRLVSCPPVVTRELARAREGRDRAEARVAALEAGLREIGAHCQGSASASLSAHFRERWLAIQRIADRALGARKP